MLDNHSLEENNKSKRGYLLIFSIFVVLVVITGFLALALKKKKVDYQTEFQNEYQKVTQDLYQGVSLERDQEKLARGRFVKIDGNSLYVEFYYRYTNQAATEAIILVDKTVFECEERYFTASDGTKIDKLNAMTDTSNYYGQYTTGGLGRRWFEKNAEVGEAVEVRFLGDGSDRIPTEVLLYKEICNKS